MQSKTKAAYLPLIDMTPSNPDTIMTALHEAKRLTNERVRRMQYSPAINNKKVDVLGEHADEICM